MKAKMIIEFSEAYCKEVCKQLGIATAEELSGVLKFVLSDEISQDNEVKLSVEVEE